MFKFNEEGELLSDLSSSRPLIPGFMSFIVEKGRVFVAAMKKISDEWKYQVRVLDQEKWSTI